ncbi:hypothetical protein ACWDG1_09355 [Streptomyces sp. NPDC001177]
MTDPTAAIEVWARMLCAADVHVHGDDHPTWQQLVGDPGQRIRDDYREAARWLLPRMTVAPKPASAALPEPTSRAAVLTDAERDVLCSALDLAEEEMLARGDDEDQLEALNTLRRLAAEAPQQEPEARLAAGFVNPQTGTGYATGGNWHPPEIDADPAEAHRLALSTALGLGTGAPWDAIRDRAAELAGARQQSDTEAPVLVETLARLLCDADDALTDGPSWDRLSQTPGLGRDEYRNAARYLLRHVTVTQAIDGAAPLLCGDQIPGMTCTLPDGPHDDWRHRDEVGHWWSQMRVPPYTNRDRLAAPVEPAAVDGKETHRG